MGRSWKIGAVEIHQVVEIVAPTPLGMLFPDASPERLEPLSDWLRPYFLDDQGNMILSIHAFAIRSGDARIIVDTCLGNGKTRPIPDWSDLETTFLSDLEAAGFPPASVDRVLCTHASGRTGKRRTIPSRLRPSRTRSFRSSTRGSWTSSSRTIASTRRSS